MAFAQKDMSEITCYHYSGRGHFAKTSPNKKTNNVAQVHSQIAKELEDEEESGRLVF